VTPAVTAPAVVQAPPVAGQAPPSTGPRRGLRALLDTARTPWGQSVRAALSVLAAAYLMLAAITVVAWLPQPETPSLGKAVRLWRRWDIEWFLRIAREGYAGPHVDTTGSPAFFPLFPMLIRLADRVLPGTLLQAAIVVSSLAVFGALTVLHRLLARELDDDTAGRALWYLLAFPTAFFLLLPYNHGLDLLFVAGFFLLLRGERWWWAAAVGGLATATRSSGILLLIAFGYEYVRRHGWRLNRSALAVTLIPTGLLAYTTYLWWQFGNPLAFSDAQNHWGRAFAWPWQSIPEAMANATAVQHGLDRLAVDNLLDVVVVAVMVALLVLAVVGPWRLRRDQLVYPLYGVALLGLLIAFPSTLPKVAEPLVSVSRLVLAEFPAFMVLARAGRNPGVDRPYLAISVALQGILAAYLIHGGWVA
jgi:hypothetical protein